MRMAPVATRTILLLTGLLAGCASGRGSEIAATRSSAPSVPPQALSTCAELPLQADAAATIQTDLPCYEAREDNVTSGASYTDTLRLNLVWIAHYLQLPPGQDVSGTYRLRYRIHEWWRTGSAPTLDVEKGPLLHQQQRVSNSFVIIDRRCAETRTSRVRVTWTLASEVGRARAAAAI